MTSALHYPFAPGFKAAGTSAAAALKVAESAGRIQAQVLEALQADDLTTDECAAVIRPVGMTDVLFERFKRNVRSRFSELSGEGKIFKTTRERLNDSGSMATVWTGSKPFSLEN